MMKNYIKKINLNIYSMIKHGSVAVATLFIVGTFFGTKNVMLAFPIALTSTVMSRQNLEVKTLNKALRLCFLDLLIVLTAFISSQNLYIGIFINFSAIFLIVYTIVSPYDLSFYKPFLMLYIFTQYAAVPFSELPFRLLSIVVGVFIIVIASVIAKSNEKSKLGNTLRNSFQLILMQGENKLQNNYDISLQNKISKLMRELAYRIYITRHKHYFTTNLGKIQFELLLSIEHLNLSLNYMDNNELNFSMKVFKNLINFDKGENTLGKVKELIKEFENENGSTEVLINIKLIYKSVEDIMRIGPKEINKIYKEWDRSDIDLIKNVFKEYFKKDSIRFKFAMRMAIIMTITMFVGELKGYYKVIWAIITIMTIMQPYYEDTIVKAKDRILGNIAAIAFTGIILNIVNEKWFTISILVIALFLLYGFKEFYKISLFSGIASMCIASLTQNIYILIYYRLLYLIIGVVLAIIINKYVFPYRLKDGTKDLVSKILRLNGKLVNSTESYINLAKDKNDLRDIIIHSVLLTEKLYLRNLQYKDEALDKFITFNSWFINNVGYELFENNCEDKNKLIDYVKGAHNKFLEDVSYL